MSAPETLRELAQQAASSPKVGMAVSTGTAAVSAVASSFDLHGFLVDISMVVGVIVTLLLGIVHYRRGKQIERETELLQIKIERARKGLPIDGE